VILRTTANLNSSLFQHALDDLVGLRWVGLTGDVCIWPAAQGDGENAADGMVGRPHDPKFGMGLGIEGSSIAETAEDNRWGCGLLRTVGIPLLFLCMMRKASTYEATVE